MAHLGGQFAGILCIDTSPDRMDGLVAALEQLDQTGLSVSICRDASTAPVAGTAAESSATATAIELELTGSDRPGIVAEVSNVLHALNINVETIHTECRAAPMSGGQLFYASANLSLPAQTSAGELREKLEAIAADLMVDITLSEA